ncbi:6-bladed beta-propeller [Paramuribaculum intestinale]|uniref:6-bladed beta-propeller n=1 Tax=Paramuribaculum intestinale TaxID=2094151 RepID=UPI0025A964BD|nr:6-bladed beta-propeller [Paramuribaculum intestinale]
MNTKIILSATAAIAMTLCACGSDQSDRPLTVIDIETLVDAADTGEGRLEMLIHPEVTDSTMLGISNIAGTVGNRLFVSDKGQLITFDTKSGRCIGAFNRRGGGPGEYHSAIQPYPSVDGNGWEVFDLISDKLFRYDLHGNHLGTIDTLGIERDFPLPGGYWGGLTHAKDGEELSLKIFDRNWRLTDSIPSGAYYLVAHMGNSTVGMGADIITGKDIALIQHEFNDTLYSIVSGEKNLKPYAVIDPGKYAIPDPRKYSNLDAWEADRRNTIRVRFIPSAEQMMLGYMYENKLYLQVVDLTDGTLLFSRTVDPDTRGKGFVMDYDGKEVLTMPIPYSDGDGFYFLILDESMSELTGVEDTNPAIVKVRF